MNRREIPARLVLFAPSNDVTAATALLREAGADIASLILRTEGLDDADILSRAQALAEAAPDAALLLADRADLVSKAKADGAHLSNFPAQTSAISSLKPKLIAGAAGLASRHDAMLAGEAGVDYVMFGEPVDGKSPSPDAVAERISWWAEIFEVPCVAFAASPDEISSLIRTGADFIALDDAIWKAAMPEEALKSAMAHLQIERTE